MPDPLIALTTCPNEAVAAEIAKVMVSEQLAACVNRISGVRSTYMWDGRLQDDSEVLLIIKTTRAQLPRLESRLVEVHPYELPELICLPVEGGSQAYLDWVSAAVTMAKRSE
jgi:periplasmic divalent cation tolerance protein